MKTRKAFLAMPMAFLLMALAGSPNAWGKETRGDYPWLIGNAEHECGLDSPKHKGHQRGFSDDEFRYLWTHAYRELRLCKNYLNKKQHYTLTYNELRREARMGYDFDPPGYKKEPAKGTFWVCPGGKLEWVDYGAKKMCGKDVVEKKDPLLLELPEPDSEAEK